MTAIASNMTTVTKSDNTKYWGHQKLGDNDITQMVNRLYQIPSSRERIYKRPGRVLEKNEVEDMVARLTDVDKDRVPESDRRVKASSHKTSGVVASFAWKGYN